MNQDKKRLPRSRVDIPPPGHEMTMSLSGFHDNNIVARWLIGIPLSAIAINLVNRGSRSETRIQQAVIINPVDQGKAQRLLLCLCKAPQKTSFAVQ